MKQCVPAVPEDVEKAHRHFQKCWSFDDVSEFERAEKGTVPTNLWAEVQEAFAWSVSYQARVPNPDYDPSLPEDPVAA